MSDNEPPVPEPAAAGITWNGKPITQAAGVEFLCDPETKEPFCDAFVWKDFLQTQLDVDPEVLFASLCSLPSWPDTEPIRYRPKGDDVRWIRGSHPALRSRGNALKRDKLWLQTNYTKGYIRYQYTGWQHAVAYAKQAVESLPEVAAVLREYYDGRINE